MSFFKFVALAIFCYQFSSVLGRRARTIDKGEFIYVAVACYTLVDAQMLGQLWEQCSVGENLENLALIVLTVSSIVVLWKLENTKLNSFRSFIEDMQKSSGDVTFVPWLPNGVHEGPMLEQQKLMASRQILWRWEVVCVSVTRRDQENVQDIHYEHIKGAWEIQLLAKHALNRMLRRDNFS